MRLSSAATSLALLLCALWVLPAAAQTLQIEVSPDPLRMEVGETIKPTIRVVNTESGEALEDLRVVLFARNRRALAVDRRSGEVSAVTHGDHALVVMAFGPDGRIEHEVTVHVPAPPLERITFHYDQPSVYQHTSLSLVLDLVDTRGNHRDDVALTLTSSDPAVASVDAFNVLTAHQVGTVTLRAQAEDVVETLTLTVRPNPVARVELEGLPMARTGDVVPFVATAYDAAGAPVPDAPVDFAFQARPDDPLGPAATGQIMPDGRFVAEAAGLYTITATSGRHSAQHRMRITSRGVSNAIEVLGQQSVEVYTSDLWVWEGVDGNDYAVTGTWGANGEAYFWDVSNPAGPVIIDTVTVDARTVNDVKVNERGDICVISREGASTRRNGLVILDCSDPHNVKIITEYDENLTGGVHNVYIDGDLIYALSAGQRYDIIDIKDPAHPHRIGSFELDDPGHSIHDVWVEDGIAYSSNWSNGVVMVDVGNGVKGGSPENPVMIGRYAYPSGWNHAAFPYKNEETGKFYIVAGDEHFVEPNRTPEGWIHFIDFTDPEHPQEVARYEVPEAGTHNFWIEDDKLYVAYYQGGLRVVDISGDLMGDLYRQDREIAKYVTEAQDGFLPNKARAWGTMTHKGMIYLADKHSGLWILQLESEKKKKEKREL